MDEYSDKIAYSEEVSKFIRFLDAAKQEYAHFQEELQYQDKIKTDCLHLLELKCTSPEDHIHVSTMLQRCLLTRRKCKDALAVLEPLIQYLDSDKGKLAVNLLPQVLGKMRKEENRIEERTYVPRAMTDTEYQNVVPDKV